MSMLCTQFTLQHSDQSNPQPFAKVALWNLISATLFPYLPNPAYRVRRILLRAFGATLDPHSRIRSGVRISHPWNLTIGRKSSIGQDTHIFNPAPLTIGDRTIISQLCMLSCVASPNNDATKSQKPYPITIGNDTWIAIDCVVTGNQTIPNGVIIGARSHIDHTKLRPWTICTGHPATSRRDRPYKGFKA